MNQYEFYGCDELPGILDQKECIFLKHELDTEFATRPVHFDEGRGLVKMIYRPKPALFVFERLHYFLERYLNTKLYPTYWFTTQYYNKSYMAAHTDREACEVSVSLNVHQDNPWHLKVKDKTGKKHSLATPPGDAVLYNGIECEHWRTPYAGQNYTQLFLHYVKQSGKYSRYRYDSHSEGV